MSLLSSEDLAIWNDAEDKFYATPADDHVEAIVYQELALSVLAARTKACRQAEERFRKAYAAMLNARGEMLRAAAVVEDTHRLVTIWREM